MIPQRMADLLERNLSAAEGLQWNVAKETHAEHTRRKAEAKANAVVAALAEFYNQEAS